MSVLTQKIGPLPGWAWGGIAAVGVWWFFLRGKTGASTTTNAAAAGSQLSSGYGLGYAQGVQANPPPPPATKPGGPSTFTPNLGQVGVWLFGSPSFTGQSGVKGVAAPGTSLPSAGPAVTGASYTDPFGNGPSNLWQPVTYNGQTLYAFAPQLAAVGAAPGIGGGRPAGSRSANLMHHAHPLVGARVPYQFHVRAVGGLANHTREVHRVALQAGVHPARIMMLNPVPTGFIRVA